MWLLVLLLAFMASSFACPDPCECHPLERGDLAVLIEVSCTGRIPRPANLPADTHRLKIDSAQQWDVVDLLGDFENISSELPYLNELVITNCSVSTLNVSLMGFDRVQILNISRNSFVDLNDVQIVNMVNLSSLTVFDVSNNFISNIIAEAFRTLGTLVWLSLKRNNISDVNKDAFSGLELLENLDLSDNKLASLPDNALTPLNSLQKLDLSGNQLQVLGARWFESLGRLRELDVSRNGLAKAASGALQPLPGLSVLRLAGNPLQERDVSLLLGTGRKLETVDASRTGLARVPSALTRSVRALRLAGNKLTSIRGGDLDSYPLLRLLDISDNRLDDVEEDALGRLEVLEDLNISGNVLTYVPRSLPSSLTALNLEKNFITILKFNDLQGLYNLQSLFLTNNAIDEIQEGSLSQLPALIELDISNNPIKALPANTLNGPSNLAKLRMSGLTSLKWDKQEQGDMAFPVPAPERLVTLDVSRSPVLAAQLLTDTAALSACKSLTELNLVETNISTLRSDLIFFLPQLHSLGLNNNSWECTEDLFWLGEWVRQLNELHPPARCAKPINITYLYEMPVPPTPVPTTRRSTDVTSPMSNSFAFQTNVTSRMPVAVKAQTNPPNILTSSNIAKISTEDIMSDSRPEAFDIHKAKYSTTTHVGLEDKNTSIDAHRSPTTRELLNSQQLTLPTSEQPSHVFQVIRSFSQTENHVVQNTIANEKHPLNNTLRNGTGYTSTEQSHRSIPVLNNHILLANESHGSDVDHKGQVVHHPADNELERTVQKDDMFINTTSLRNETEHTTNSSNKTFPDAISIEAYSDPPSNVKTKNQALSASGNLTKSIVPAVASLNTVAEELSGQATDSGARVAEPLSAGAHPGMLVLAGAALGAAAALTVVLSRRATARRRDRYQRHENIEVHTLTPVTDLW